METPGGARTWLSGRNVGDGADVGDVRAETPGGNRPWLSGGTRGDGSAEKPGGARPWLSRGGKGDGGTVTPCRVRPWLSGRKEGDGGAEALVLWISEPSVKVLNSFTVRNNINKIWIIIWNC